MGIQALDESVGPKRRAAFEEMNTAQLVRELLLRWDQFADESRYEAAQERGEETVHPFLLALQERGDRSVYEAASALIKSTDRDKRLAGLAILRELGPSDARPVFPEIWELLEQLSNSEEDSGVLREVLLCLGRTYQPRALQTLVRFSDSPDPELRFVVANCLLGCGEQLDDPMLLQLLVNLARDPDEEVRWAALWEINQYLLIDSETVRSLLNELRFDPSPDVRELAEEGIGKLQETSERDRST